MIAAIGVVGVVILILGVLAYVSDGLSWLREKRNGEDFRSRWDDRGPDERS